MRANVGRSMSEIPAYKHKTFDALCSSRAFLADQCEGEWLRLMRPPRSRHPSLPDSSIGLTANWVFSPH